MRALQFDRHGEPRDVLELREVQPAPMKAGQARVRMLLTPINPSDLLRVRGLYGAMPSYPASPGFEGVGIIEESKAPFSKLFRGIGAGRKVVVLNQFTGNWQDQVVLPAYRLFPVPEGVSDHDAAGYFVNPATALIMTKYELKVPEGAWLLQSAAGSSLGKMVIKLGKKLGFKTINIVRRAETAEIIKKLGADETIDAAKEDVVARVKEITKGQGVRYALDAVGGTAVSQVIQCLGEHGHILLYGSLDMSPGEFTNRHIIGNNIKIESFALQRWSAAKSSLQLLSLLKEIGRLMQENILTADIAEVFPIDRFQEAIVAAETPGRQGKILLQMGT